MHPRVSARAVVTGAALLTLAVVPPEVAAQRSPVRATGAGASSTIIRSVQVGQNARGRRVRVEIACDRQNTHCELLDIPMGGGKAERPIRGLLPRGALAADQWGNRIVVSTTNLGDTHYTSSSPGTFERTPDGSWKRLTGEVATTIELRGSRLLADLQQTAGGQVGASTLETFNLSRRVQRRILARHHSDFAQDCRLYSHCSIYVSVHLDQRYAYWLEQTGTVYYALGTSKMRSVVCREDLNARSHTLSRWIAPRPLDRLAVSFQLSFFAAPATPGGTTVPYRAHPRWSPAAAPLADEYGGPCLTRAPAGDS